MVLQHCMRLSQNHISIWIQHQFASLYFILWGMVPSFTQVLSWEAVEVGREITLGIILVSSLCLTFHIQSLMLPLVQLGNVHLFPSFQSHCQDPITHRLSSPSNVFTCAFSSEVALSNPPSPSSYVLFPWVGFCPFLCKCPVASCNSSTWWNAHLFAGSTGSWILGQFLTLTPALKTLRLRNQRILTHSQQ